MAEVLKNPRVFVPLSLVVLFIIYIIDPFTSEEDEIKAILRRIEKEYYLSKTENKLQFASRVAKLSEVFSPDATANILFKYRGEQKIQGRDGVKQSMTSAAGQLSEFNVAFQNTTIALTSGDSANVDTGCEIQYQEDELYQARDMRFEFEKIDGAWLIKSVKNSEPWEF